MFTIEGIFYLDSFYTQIESGGDINLRIKLSEDVSDSYNYITGTDESETLVGTKLNDIISGGMGDDYIYADEGNDIIILSEAGKETFDGGQGDDKLELHLENWTAPEGFIGEVNLVDGWLGSHQSPNVEGSDTITNVENVTLFGDVDYVMRGDSNDNLFITHGGDDKLYGGDGHDTLKSGAGADEIYGEDGNDILILNEGTGIQFFDGGEGT